MVALSNLNGRHGRIADQLSAVAYGEAVVLPPERKSVPVAKSILESMWVPTNSVPTSRSGSPSKATSS